MPTQIPKSGVPDATAPSMASRQGASSLAVALKCPTPGTITPRACRHCSGIDGTTKSAPSAVSALRTEVRLPAP
jgi:hypothetical protein